jgi:rod shape-determining protein MreC
VAGVQDSFKYLDTLNSVKASEQEAHKKLLLLSQRANQVETLALENSRLRQLLSLKETLSTPAQAAEVLYDAMDPYSRKIIVNRGSVHAVQLGSPVIDELGVLGQVVRVFPLTSEVAMIIDREQTTPVLNTRTGVRSVAYGNPSANGDVLELRFISGNADVLAGDVLTTSGVDGVYPTGLLVAKIEKVERRADSGFAKIICTPKANVLGAKHVMILNPLSTVDTPRPAENIPAAPSKRGAKK